MQTMDSHLAQLVRMGKVTRALAESRAAVPEELKRLLGGMPAPAVQPQQAAPGQVPGAAPRPNTGLAGVGQ
jgi:hypothetical protein